MSRQLLSTLIAAMMLLLPVFKSYSQFKEDKLLHPVYLKAQSHKSTQIDSAIYFANECDSLAILQNNYQYRVMCHNLKGGAYLGAWSLELAKSEFRKGLKLLETHQNDSLSALLLNNFGIIYDIQGIQDSALLLFRKSIEINKGRGDLHSIADTYNNIGLSYYFSSQNDSAMKYYETGISYYKQAKDSIGIADILCNKGNISYEVGDYILALMQYVEADKIYEFQGDKRKSAFTKYNISGLHKSLGEYDKALEYIDKSIELRKEFANPMEIAEGYYKKGSILQHLKRYEEALVYAEKAYEFFKKSNNEKWVSTLLNLLGTIKMGENKHVEAIQYLNESVELKKKLTDSLGVAIALLNMGISNYELGNAQLALNNLSEGITFFQVEDEYSLLVDYNAAFAEVYETLGDCENALKYQQLYTLSKDSINNHNKFKIMRQYETIYETEKKEVQINLLNKDNLIKHKQIEADKFRNEKEKTIRYALILGIILIVVFAMFIFNRFRITNKQKNVIEEQKLEVEEKNREIIDSISYAKRIQSAILPPQKLVKEYLQESFILYKPKDIVAGDFYWMETVHNITNVEENIVPGSMSLNKEIILFAAADCTGHGVPGAMVSVVCNNALNRSVREYGLTTPGEILDKTREIVIQEFEKSEEDVKDGMDIALCSLRFDVQGSRLKKTTSTKNPSTSNLKPQTIALLQYAGAHNPLWIIRKGEIIETKADKQPIGKFDRQAPYTTHTFELEKGDVIYIFSDGFVDQFGGDKGKKFKAKAFRQLLLSIQDKTMEEQQVLIDKAFETWRGDLEQIDDVCIIGVRV